VAGCACRLVAANLPKNGSENGLHFQLPSRLGRPTIAKFMQEKEMSLFAGLRKLRDLERRHLPFARSLAEFDLIIEIGYHEERGKALTYKHLLTLGFCARTTLNRRLNGLVEQGVITRTRSARDARAVVLGVSKSAMQRLHRYRGGMIAVLTEAR
jgi:DNA-binding MarR family transcriptional regulator